MDTLSRLYIRQAAGLKYENLKPDTILRVKNCVKHQLACACAGRNERWNTIARDYIKDISRGSATLWFTSQHASPFDAAFANSTMGMSIIQEDIHREDGIHPGLVIIPCAFAVGDEYKLSGRQVIEGIVKGYQFFLKTGKSVLGDEFNMRGFRPTAIMGTYASAFTAGVLMGLDEDSLVNAIGIAGNFSCGINEWAQSGADEVYFHNGMSSAAGIMAAELAKRGATGSQTIFEGRQGSCNAYGLSEKILRDNIENDTVLEIDKVVFKGAPCCNFNQATATIALQAAEDGIKPGMVKSGTIFTNTRATEYSGVDYGGPCNSATQAKMSMQYVFAAMLKYADPVNEAFNDFKDNEIKRLASVLTVKPNKEYDRIYPSRMQGRVVLTLNDGTEKTYSTEEARYYNYADIERGFIHYFSEAYSMEKAEYLSAMIDRLENIADISELTKELEM